MNLLVVLGIFAVLVVLLGLLQNWQRKVEDVRREKTLEEIRTAEERGSHQPLAQHPIIDAEACIGCGTCIKACPEDGVLALVDGIARVVHGARCIGHGFCADACPVAAVKIGLGEVASRPDIPILDDRLETTVPGVHIAGELGGFSLIRNAVDQGAQAVRLIAEELDAETPPPSDDVVDLVIVGAGPAGFSATLQAMELGLRHVTIDQDDLGGTVRQYPRRKLTITGAVPLPLHGRIRKKQFLKEELIAFWEKVVQEHGVEIHSGVRLLSVEPHSEGVHLVRTTSGDIAARRVLLALGKRGTPRKLGVPGEESEKVFYQLVDASTYERQHLLVVGGGDSAIEAAVALAEGRGNVVTVSYRRSAFFRLKARNEKRIAKLLDKGKLRAIFDSDVVEIDRDAVTLRVREGEATREERLRNDHVFIFAGGDPPFPLLRGIGIHFAGDDVPGQNEPAPREEIAGAS